jgi:hypothetical protein
MKITKGKFEVSDFSHLALSTRRMIRDSLNIGDDITLISDPYNAHDKTAIKVTWKEVQIGWYSAYGYRQKEMFEHLMN